jgi:two-component system phosphoglycerate transport system response regulator PgtA
LKKATKRTPKPGRSIVIVDDEKSYVELMAEMIGENMDCPVHSFTRPADALGSLPRVSAGVIVTDYFMPGMDGVEFIRKASKIAPDAAFIMISGHNLEPIEEELAKLKKLKERLQKPFGWRPLAEAVLKVWPGDDAPSLRPAAG